MRLRVASFNLGLGLATPQALSQRLARREDPLLGRLSALLQALQADILLLNEFDNDGEGRDLGAVDRFCRDWLATPGPDGLAIDYPYRWSIPTNTGLLAACDLDGDGRLTLPGDGLGFGHFPGQYAMLLLSRWPLDSAARRTFRQLRWATLPAACLPDREPGSGRGDYYSAAALAELRLSSKNHVDVGVCLPDGRTLQLLLSHPTPPVFDGPERRNRCRNHDEIRLWCDYLDGAEWLQDDDGRRGGMAPDARFVLLGDLNADPHGGDGDRRAIRRLLAHPRLHAGVATGALRPRSPGALAYASGAYGRRVRQFHGGRQRGIPNPANAAYWTHLRGLRLDYVLPSANLTVLDSGVWWPAPGEPGRHWLADPQADAVRPSDGDRASWCSDHRPVWVDLQL